MKLFLAVFLFLVSYNIFPLGKAETSKKDAETAPEPALVKISGEVRIYGSEPHTFAGIVDEAGVEYAVYPPESEEDVRKLQGHFVEFTVMVLDKPQGYGSLFLKGGTVTPVSWKILQ